METSMEMEKETNLEDDEEINIYDDLCDFDLGEEVEKLKTENRRLQGLINSLQADIDKLNTTIAELKEIQNNLTKNISALFITAKAEIERKDRMIEELRTQVDNRHLSKFNPEYNKRKERESTSFDANKLKKFKHDANPPKSDTLDIDKERSKSDETRQKSRSVRSSERLKYAEYDKRESHSSSSRHSRPSDSNKLKKFKHDANPPKSDTLGDILDIDKHRSKSDETRQESRSVYSSERLKYTEDNARQSRSSSSSHSRERSRERYNDQFDNIRYDSKYPNDRFNENDKYDSRSKYNNKRGHYEEDAHYSRSKYAYDKYNYPSQYDSDNRYDNRMSDHVNVGRDKAYGNRGERNRNQKTRSTFGDRSVRDRDECNREELERHNKHRNRSLDHSLDHHNSRYYRHEQGFSEVSHRPRSPSPIPEIKEITVWSVQGETKPDSRPVTPMPLPEDIEIPKPKPPKKRLKMLEDMEKKVKKNRLSQTSNNSTDQFDSPIKMTLDKCKDLLNASRDFEIDKNSVTSSKSTKSNKSDGSFQEFTLGKESKSVKDRLSKKNSTEYPNNIRNEKNIVQNVDICSKIGAKQRIAETEKKNNKRKNSTGMVTDGLDLTLDKGMTKSGAPVIKNVRTDPEKGTKGSLSTKKHDREAFSHSRKDKDKENNNKETTKQNIDAQVNKREINLNNDNIKSTVDMLTASKSSKKIKISSDFAEASTVKQKEIEEHPPDFAEESAVKQKKIEEHNLKKRSHQISKELDQTHSPAQEKNCINKKIDELFGRENEDIVKDSKKKFEEPKSRIIKNTEDVVKKRQEENGNTRSEENISKRDATKKRIEDMPTNEKIVDSDNPSKLNKCEDKTGKKCSNQNLIKEGIEDTPKYEASTSYEKSRKEIQSKGKNDKTCSSENVMKQSIIHEDVEEKIENKKNMDNESASESTNRKNKGEQIIEKHFSKESIANQDIRKEVIEYKSKSEKSGDYEKSNKQKKSEEKREKACSKEDAANQDGIGQKPENARNIDYKDTNKESKSEEMDRKQYSKENVTTKQHASENTPKYEASTTSYGKSSKEAKSEGKNCKTSSKENVIKQGIIIHDEIEDKTKNKKNIDNESTNMNNKSQEIIENKCSKEDIASQDIDKEIIEYKSKSEKSVDYEKSNKQKKSEEKGGNDFSKEGAAKQDVVGGNVDHEDTNKESKSEETDRKQYSKENVTKQQACEGEIGDKLTEKNMIYEISSKQNKYEEISKQACSKEKFTKEYVVEENNVDINLEKTDVKEIGEIVDDKLVTKESCVEPNRECDSESSKEIDIHCEDQIMATTEHQALGRKSDRIVKQNKKRSSTESVTDSDKEDKKQAVSTKNASKSNKPDKIKKDGETSRDNIIMNVGDVNCKIDDSSTKEDKKETDKPSKIVEEAKQTNSEHEMKYEGESRNNKKVNKEHETSTGSSKSNKNEVKSKENEINKKDDVVAKPNQTEDGAGLITVDLKRKRRKSTHVIQASSGFESKIQKLAEDPTNQDISKSDDEAERHKKKSKNGETENSVNLETAHILKAKTNEIADEKIAELPREDLEPASIKTTEQSKKQNKIGSQEKNTSNKDKDNSLGEIKAIRVESHQRSRVNEVKKHVRFASEESTLNKDISAIFEIPNISNKVTSEKDSENGTILKITQNKELGKDGENYEKLDDPPEAECSVNENKKALSLSCLEDSIDGTNPSISGQGNQSHKSHTVLDNDINTCTDADKNVSGNTSLNNTNLSLFSISDIEIGTGEESFDETLNSMKPVDKLIEINHVELEKTDEDESIPSSDSSTSEDTVLMCEPDKRKALDAKLDNLLKQYMDNFTVEDVGSGSGKVNEIEYKPVAPIDENKETESNTTSEEILVEPPPVTISSEPKIKVLKIVSITGSSYKVHNISHDTSGASTVENIAVSDTVTTVSTNLEISTSGSKTQKVAYDATKSKKKRRITPTPVKDDKPVCSFENILTKPDTLITTVSSMESPLHLTDEGEIPVLHLEENQLNNLPTEVNINDKIIINLLETMNISNIDCDTSKFKNISAENETVVNSVAVESKTNNLSFENIIRKVTCVPVVSAKSQSSIISDVPDDINSVTVSGMSTPSNSSVDNSVSSVVQSGTPSTFRRRKRRCRLVIIG